MRVLILSQYYKPEPIPNPSDLTEYLLEKGHAASVVTGFPTALAVFYILASTLAEAECAICCLDYEEGSLIKALQFSATMMGADVAVMRTRAREWVGKSFLETLRMGSCSRALGSL